MRVKISSGKQSAVGMTVRVHGFLEEGDQVGVKGVNSLTGEEVVMWLTVKGERASNAKRKSIGELRDGFKIGRTTYKLEPGGLVYFKTTFPKKDVRGHHWSTWANVLGYNKEDALENCFYGRAGSLRIIMPQEGDTWKPFGIVSIHMTDPVYHITGRNAEGVLPSLVACRNKFAKPSFIARVLNPEGKVVGFFEIESKHTFNRDKGVEYTPEEYGQVCAKLIKEQLSCYSGEVSLNLLPTANHPVSTIPLNSTDPKENQILYWRNLEEHFYRDIEDHGEIYRDYFCKEFFGKFSFPVNGQKFVNNLFLMEQDKGKGWVDPVLIGGLEYAGMEQSVRPVPERPQQTSYQEPTQERSHTSLQEPEPEQKPAPQTSAPQTSNQGSKSEPDTDPELLYGVEAGEYHGFGSDGFINDGFAGPGMY